MSTAGDGKFSFPGLKPGAYAITPHPGKFSRRISLQALEPQLAAVDSGKPASVQITVKALRSISGKVTVYDKNLMRAVPLAGAIVHLAAVHLNTELLQDLSIQAVAAENGAFIFRNLPAGTYTLAVEYQGQETTRTVIVPSDPATIRDVELSVGVEIDDSPADRGDDVFLIFRSPDATGFRSSPRSPARGECFV